MFCSKCGKQIPDDSNVCPYCGEVINGHETLSQAANRAFDAADKELESAVHEMKETFVGNNGAKEKLNDNRGLVSYILLSIITCDIYHFYFIYKMAHDINIACDGDGESTSGLVKFIVLSIITCGIYALYWEYALANRLASNAPRYGMNFQENGTTILLWHIFGTLICGIGPFVAMHILIKNSNKICAAYNAK